MTVFLGIDPTSSDRKPSACALLDEDGSLVKLASPRTDADIVELAARCRPDIVAIDATEPWGAPPHKMLPRGLLREPPAAVRRADAHCHICRAPMQQGLVS